jgi:CubicO group peptidase (beta-lactamase class C family)
VTLRDLLSRRTGVPDDLPAGWFERYRTAEDLIKAAMRSKPTARLGQRFQYNNYMVVAVGEALAAAHGTTFEAVLVRRVFGPLGMRTTSLSLGAMRQGDDFSQGYGDDQARTRLPMDTMAYLHGIAAAGGINSNAEEMANWLRLLLGGGILDGKRLLSDAGYRELITPAIRTSSGHYGLGMEIEEWHGYRSYFHRGGVLGFAARFDILPAERLGWAVLTNVDDEALPRAIRESVYEILVRRNPADVGPDSRLRAQSKGPWLFAISKAD